MIHNSLKLATEFAKFLVMHSILVVEMARLGDVICMVPALGRLRKAFPNALITCVVQDKYTCLVRALDLDLQAIGVAGTQKFTGLGRGLREIRRVHADLACAMSPGKRNALLALGSGARVKAGYMRFVSAQVQYLHESPVNVFGRKASAKASYGYEHFSLRAMKVCDVLGIAGDASTTPLGFRSDSMAQADQRIEGFLSDVRKPYVAIHPFAAWEYREWGTGSFVELARRIGTEFASDVVVVCEEGERSRWEESSNAVSGAHRAHVFSSTSLLETAAVIRGAWAMIGNDSGPLHLAALCGVPVVGLYGPASPELTAPQNARGVFLYHRMQCSPCSQTFCTHPQDPCMKKIEINEVLSAMQTLPGARALLNASTHA